MKSLGHEVIAPQIDYDGDSDFFIKSGNLGGFQIFYNEEFFAPFGLSGQVSKGFFFKEKINTVKNVRILKNEY